MDWLPVLLCIVGLAALTGCAESVAVVGNGISMVVACLLLWTTVTMNRGHSDG